MLFYNNKNFSIYNISIKNTINYYAFLSKIIILTKVIISIYRYIKGILKNLLFY